MTDIRPPTEAELRHYLETMCVPVAVLPDDLRRALDEASLLDAASQTIAVTDLTRWARAAGADVARRVDLVLLALDHQGTSLPKDD
jgi:hypothetical protein